MGKNGDEIALNSWCFILIIIMDFERVVLSSWKLHWLRLNIWSCQPKPTQTIPSPSLTARSLYANWTLAHACPAPKRGGWGGGAPFFDPRGLEDLLRRFHLIAVIGHWEIILMSSGWEQAVMNTARSHIVTPVQGMRAGWLISLSLGPARLESPDLWRTDLCRESMHPEGHWLTEQRCYFSSSFVFSWLDHVWTMQVRRILAQKSYLPCPELTEHTGYFLFFLEKSRAVLSAHINIPESHYW